MKETVPTYLKRYSTSREWQGTTLKGHREGSTRSSHPPWLVAHTQRFYPNDDGSSPVPTCTRRHRDPNSSKSEGMIDLAQEHLFAASQAGWQPPACTSKAWRPCGSQLPHTHTSASSNAADPDPGPDPSADPACSHHPTHPTPCRLAACFTSSAHPPP